MLEKQLEMEKYVEQMSQVLDLSLDQESRVKVVENLITISRIAQLVTEYSLPDTIESASKFEP